MRVRASQARSREPEAQRWLLLGSGGLTAAGLALADQPAALLFCTAQTLVLASLFARAVAGRRGWRSAEFVVAVAWMLLFAVPCWLYAVDPGLLDQGTPARAILIVNIALYGYLLGLLARPVVGPPLGGPVAVVAMQARPRVLIAWWVVGLAGLAALLLRHGNPLDYLSHLDRSAALNLGAFYLVAIALLMRYAALAWAAASWSHGEPLRALPIALGIGGTILIGLTGGRLFVAVALADFLLLYVLLRRPIPLRRIAPYAAVLGLLIVFGLGTLKRYQGYNAAHPDAHVGLVHYATKQAPSEFASAYANNYVDSVRLIAIADRLVPRSADWEGGRALVEMAVKPLPRPIRPTVRRQRVLQEAFNPSEDYAFAMPLIGTAFLAGGIIVVLLVCLGTGALVGWLDRRLSSDALSARSAAVLVVAAVSFPSVMRAGVPAGVVLLLVDVIGMWVVARTGLRHAAAQTVDRPPQPPASQPAMLGGTGSPN
jgi:hypothetical protein